MEEEEFVLIDSDGSERITMLRPSVIEKLRNDLERECIKLREVLNVTFCSVCCNPEFDERLEYVKTLVMEQCSETMSEVLDTAEEIKRKCVCEEMVTGFL